MTEFIERAANKNSLIQRKLICGIGINDADYIVKNKINGKTIDCYFYRTWRSMIKRCYSDKFHITQPTYRGCSVCNEWLYFSNFKAWMEMQNFKGKQLDKDLLFPGNKIYSHETCMFVSQRVNSLLTDSRKARGSYAIGVHLSKANKKFVAMCDNGIKTKNIGYFNTEQEAHQAYLKYKKQVITEVALEQDDIRLKDALLRIADTYEIQI